MTQFYVTDTTLTVYPLDIYQEYIREACGVGDSFSPRYDVLVQEVIANNSLITNNTIFYVVAFSIIKNREGNNGLGGGVYWKDVNDKETITDTIASTPSILVSSSMLVYPVGVITGNSAWSFSDSITSSAVLTGDYGKLIQAVFTTSAKLTGTPAWVLRAQVQTKESFSSEAKFNLLKQEYIKFRASIVTALTTKVVEAVSVATVTSQVVKKLLKIKDTLVAKGLATSAYEAAVYLQESLKLAYQLTSGKGASINESIQILAAYTSIFGFSANAVSAVALADSTQPSLVFVLEASDTAKIIDPAGIDGGFDPTQFLGLLLNEKVAVKIGYNSDDGLWTGWVMNTQNAAVTNYSEWNFNSFATLSTVDIAASSTGLYALGGSNDSGVPISAIATFAKSDFGDSRLKRMPYAYIGVRATGQLYFITQTDDGVERVYSLVATAPGPRTERIQMARGVTSRYWQFTLENVAGSDFRLDEMELLPVTLSRRV